MADNIASRSEFVFLYDIKMTNPNGDPDENRPRIDPYSGKNLVTEYRLKRTVRDYLQAEKEKIFIREDLNTDGTRKTIEKLAEPYLKQKSVDKEKLINDHIDVRLFGLLFAVKDVVFKSVGPVQFSIGRSLNKVQEIVIRNTRIVPTKTDSKSGTFGEKTILKYSLILFHGFLNQFAAKELNLTENDVDKMMSAMWHGTNNLSTSSKFGQNSRLLLRVIYSNDKAYIGDFDEGINITNTEGIEDLRQAGLEAGRLLDMLSINKDKIAEIQFKCYDNLILSDKRNLKDIIEEWAKENKIKCKNILSG